MDENQLKKTKLFLSKTGIKLPALLNFCVVRRIFCSNGRMVRYNYEFYQTKFFAMNGRLLTLCLALLLIACGPDEDLASIVIDSDTDQNSDSGDNSDENPDSDDNSGEGTGDDSGNNGDVGTAVNNVYYVSPEGSSTNDGFTPENSLSITQGFRQVKQGDVLYIKLGNYTLTQTLTIGESGTVDEPIRIIGYRQTPGDIEQARFAGFTYGQNVQDADFPLLNGDGQNGIDVRGNYIYLSNLSFTNFASNIDLTGDYNKVSNCVFFDTADGVQKFGSFATRIYGSYNEVFNCYAEDIEFAGFQVAERGTYNHIHNCQVVCDEPRPPGGGTDYYFMTVDYGSGVTSNNLFEFNLAQRLGSVQHPGRGLDNKGGHDNIWRYNVIENTGIEMEFSTSYGNHFYGNTVRETRPEHNYNWCHFELQSGPHDNYIYGNFIDSGDYPNIVIKHSDDGASSDPNVEYRITEDNWIFSNIFLNGSSVVTVNDFNGPGQGEVRNIKILNNTIVNPSGLISVFNNVPTQIEFSNNLVVDGTGSFLNTSISLSGSNNNFFNSSSFSISGLSNSLNLDPMFVGGPDADSNSYRLQSNSPVINQGVSVTVEFDFLGEIRTIGSAPDIGAFEIN